VIFPGHRCFALLLRLCRMSYQACITSQAAGKHAGQGISLEVSGPLHTYRPRQMAHFRVEMLPSIPMRKRLSVLYSQSLLLIYGIVIPRFPGKARLDAALANCFSPSLRHNPHEETSPMSKLRTGDGRILPEPRAYPGD
jgi:hypothetical protein